MTERTDRLLAVLVILVALLLITQTTELASESISSTIGIVGGGMAVGYALKELVATR
jgi:hypothetical protein